jgi:hypothetical protein
MNSVKQVEQVEVWYVHVGLPGYLPNNSGAYPTRGAAIEGAQWEVREFRDAGYPVRGNKDDGCWTVRQGDDPYWQYIEVTSETVELADGQTMDEWLEEYNSAG